MKYYPGICDGESRIYFCEGQVSKQFVELTFATRLKIDPIKSKCSNHDLLLILEIS